MGDMTRAHVRGTIRIQRKRLSVPLLGQYALFVLISAFLFVPPLPLVPVQGEPSTVSTQTPASPEIRVLHLQGSPYQLGYQHGTQLRSDLRDAIPTQFLRSSAARGWMTYPLLMAYARRVDGYLPPDIRQEMQGVADGAGLPYHEILAWNLMESYLISTEANRSDLEKQLIFGLQESLLSPESFGLSAERSSVSRAKTVPESPRQSPAENGRSLTADALLTGVVLPKTSIGLATWGNAVADRELRLGVRLYLNSDAPYGRMPVILVYHPEHGIPFWSLTWPGHVGTIAGFNGAKLGVQATAIPVADSTADGVPVSFLARQALQYTMDEESALTLILSTPAAHGATVLLGDGKVPHALRLETTPHSHATQETKEGFIASPPHFEAKDVMEGLTSTSSSDSQFPWNSVRQQLQMGREPDTVIMQALAQEELNRGSMLAILIEPATLTATIQNGRHQKIPYTLREEVR